MLTLDQVGFELGWFWDGLALVLVGLLWVRLPGWLNLGWVPAGFLLGWPGWLWAGLAMAE